MDILHAAKNIRGEGHQWFQMPYEMTTLDNILLSSNESDDTINCGTDREKQDRLWKILNSQLQDSNGNDNDSGGVIIPTLESSTVTTDECQDKSQFPPNNVNNNNNVINGNYNDISSCSSISSSHSTNNSYEAFSLALYTARKKQSTVTTFQLVSESRIRYVLRFPNLYQEFLNSGNLHKLKILFNDIFTKDVIFLTQTSPILVGRDKLLDYMTSAHQNVPDFCVFFTNVTRTKHRLVTMKGKSIGTLFYNDTSSSDQTTTFLNYF